MSEPDTFQAPDTLVTLDQALDRLAARLRPVVAVEEIPTMAAERRVLAACRTWRAPANVLNFYG